MGKRVDSQKTKEDSHEVVKTDASRSYALQKALKRKKVSKLLLKGSLEQTKQVAYKVRNTKGRRDVNPSRIVAVELANSRKGRHK